MCARVSCHHDARPLLGASSGRTPSDHSPISLHISSGIRAVVAFRKQVRFDIAKLSQGHQAAYQAQVSVGLRRWHKWRAGLLAIPGGAAPTSHALVAALYAGIVYVLSSSAHQVLGVRTNQYPLHAARPMHTHRMPDQPAAMWKYVSDQKKAQNVRDDDPFPLDITLAHMMSVYSCTQPPGTPSTRSEVHRADAFLSQLPSPPAHLHPTLVHKWTPLNSILLSRLRDGSAAGPIDQLPPELLKYAEGDLPPALATLQADMACAGFVPQEAMDGLMTYIYKKRNLPRSTLDSYRGIRVTSSLGKVSCRILADPIFPILEDYLLTLGPEQFAGRKYHSADMLATTLAMLIALHGTAPLYIILLDVKKAFDRTWRAAIWLKMLRKGCPPPMPSAGCAAPTSAYAQPSSPANASLIIRTPT